MAMAPTDSRLKPPSNVPQDNSLSGIFKQAAAPAPPPTQEDVFRTSYLNLNNQKATPFEVSEFARRRLNDPLLSALPYQSQVQYATDDQKNVPQRYADFLSQRIKDLSQVRFDPWPGAYASVARDAFDSIPKSILLDLARSSLSIEDAQSQLRGFTAFKVRDKVKANVALPTFGLDVNTATKAGRTNLYQIAGGGDPLGAARQGIGPDDLKATVQLSDMFGLTKASTAQSIATAPSKWFAKHVLDSTVMKVVNDIASSPARALDWLAREVSGQKNVTTGQILFSWLPSDSPAFHVLSGTADAVKVYYLDLLQIFGKATELSDVSRGLSNVDSVRAVEKGIDSAPVNRFVKWYSKLPEEMKGAGTLDRMAERYGWRVKPEAWERLRTEASTPLDVKRILSEEALGVGPNAQTVEKLPFFSWHRRLADVVNDGIGGNTVHMTNPYVGPFRLTWGDHIDLAKPQAMKLMRRFGDYAFGNTQTVDDWMTHLVAAPSKADRLNTLEKFAHAGLKEFAVRHGATADEADTALKIMAERFPHTAARAREPLFGFDEAPDGLKDITLPFRQTQLANEVKVFSFKDMIAYKDALRESMGKSKNLGTVLRNVDELLFKNVTVPIKRLWVGKPSTGSRIGLEESIALAGHPEFGKWFRRTAMDHYINDIAHLPFPGKVSRLDEDFFKGMEMSPDLLVSHSYKNYLGLAGRNLTAETSKELEDIAGEIGKVDPRRWHSVGPEQAAFSPAWYHVINHQVLQDPLSQLLVEHWDSPERAAIANAWLESPAGTRYVRQFSSPLSKEEEAAVAASGTDLERAKAAKILSLQTEDIARNIPDHLMTSAQSALASGAPVSLAELDASKAAGIHPSKVQAPVSLGSLSWDELTKMYPKELLKEPSFVEKAVGKPFEWGGKIADNMSREPGFAAAFINRKLELQSLSESRVTHGFEPIPEAEITKGANEYAYREIYRSTHNPAETSQADFWLRNVLPFNWSVAQFTKRWARILVHNPGYVSRLRHMVGAGEDLGFIQKDDNGNLTLNIPISADFYTHLWDKSKQPAHYAALRFGLGAAASPGGAGVFLKAPGQFFSNIALPPGMPFAASIEPGFGPFLTIPVAALTANKPKLDWLRGSLLGGFDKWDPDSGFFNNLAYSVSAAWSKSLADAVLGPHGDRAYAGTVRDLVAWADYSNKADPFQRKTWKAYANVARGYFAFKAVTQFLFPYAVTTPVFMKEKDDLRKSIDKHGDYAAGVADWLDKQDGKGWPLVTGLSEAAPQSAESGSKLPPSFLLAPTAFGEKFYRDNPEFFTKYGDSAGLFSFRKADKYDPAAFNRQMQRGLRLKRDMWGLYLQMTTEAGIHEWYDKAKPALDRAQAAGANSDVLSRVREKIMERIDSLYPGTKEFINGWSTRSEHRATTLAQLYDAVKDPAVKDRKDVQPLSIFLEQYKRVDDAARAAGYTGLGTQKRFAPVRSALVMLHDKLQSDFGYSVPLEKAYTYLFRTLLEGDTVGQ